MIHLHMLTHSLLTNCTSFRQPLHQPQPHLRPENLLPSALNRLRLHPLFNHIDEEVRFQQNPPIQRIHAVKRVVVRNQEAYPFRHIRREAERIQHLLRFGRAEALLQLAAALPVQALCFADANVVRQGSCFQQEQRVRVQLLRKPDCRA